MSEAVAFFCGLITMAIIWFINDIKNNPYMRGYADGARDGIQEIMKDFPKLKDLRNEQNDSISD